MKKLIALTLLLAAPLSAQMISDSQHPHYVCTNDGDRPGGAAQGDAAFVTSSGVMWFWDGSAWTHKADTGDSATSFFSTGTLEDARLSANVSLLGSSIGTTEITDDAVTFAKMQNVSATDKVLGRSTSGSGDIEEIACTAAGRALIDDADAAAQRTTLGLGPLATLAAPTMVPVCSVKGSDQTAIGTSYADVSGTGVSVSASKTYSFVCQLIADSDAVTTGIDVSVNGPAIGAGSMTYNSTYWVSATAIAMKPFAAYNGDTASTASNGTARAVFIVEGILVNGSTAGTLIARAKREAVGTGPNVRTGSYCCVTLLN